VVKTVDSSVEYQSAQSLPVLNKEHVSNKTASSEQKVQQSSVSAEVFKNKQNLPSLRVKSGYNVTVYNRNKIAGFFSVGCGDVANIPEFKKKSRFRILKRKKKVKETEYCILQVTPARKKLTSVTFLNRYGKESSGSYVNDLLGRLSNN